MSKIITLKDNWAFSRAYKKGKNLTSPILVTYVIKNSNNNLQIGITTSKKIGNSVERARCKRIIRAAYKELESAMNTGFDIVFVARTKTKEVKSTDVLKVMSEHLQSAGVL